MLAQGRQRLALHEAGLEEGEEEHQHRQRRQGQSEEAAVRQDAEHRQKDSENRQNGEDDQHDGPEAANLQTKFACQVTSK